MFPTTPPPGLCGACRHARVVNSSRGSTFHLCGRAADDARFAKYPRLPVVRCVGYEEEKSEGADARPPEKPSIG